MLHITCMNFEVALCGSTFYVALPFVIPNNNNDNIHQRTGRRACDVISVTKRIFVHSFVKPKNIRLVGFDIRFTTRMHTSTRGIIIWYDTLRPGILFDPGVQNYVEVVDGIEMW